MRKGSSSASRGIVAAFASIALQVVAFAHSQCIGAETGEAVVGDPHNPAALSKAVQDAYQHGARRITIAPGVYHLPALQRSAFLLDRWKDATIRAAEVTLVATGNPWGRDLFELRGCQNVTLEGGTLSQTEMTAYQGRVIAVGAEPDGRNFVDWRCDAGYPMPPANEPTFSSGVNIVDGKTRLLKLGNGDYYKVPIKPHGEGTFRLHFGAGPLKFGIGDWCIARHGDWGIKVHLVNSRNCTVRNVTLMRSGFAPIREEGDGGGNHLLGVKWTPGPRPEGATEDPLVNSMADGIHSTGASPGPDIENCVWEGVILDDCIAIHGYFQKVKSAEGTVLTLEDGSGGLKVGEPARISDDKGFFGQAIVTGMKRNPDKTLAVTLDKDLGVPAGAKLSNPRGDGAGYKIIGNHLGNTRSRGILVKSDDGLIRDNTIEGCGMAAVSVGPEYSWNEANYASHVTIEGNTIIGNARSGWGGAAILVHGDGAIGNQDIVIKNNHFVSNYQGEISIDWTDGATIAGNLFSGAQPWPESIMRRPAVALAHSRGVRLSENVLKNPEAYKPEWLVTDGKISGLIGNDPGGLRVEPSAPGGTSSPGGAANP